MELMWKIIQAILGVSAIILLLNLQNDVDKTDLIYQLTPSDKTGQSEPIRAPIAVVSPPDEKALREIIRRVLEQELAVFVHKNLDGRATNSSSSVPPAGFPAVEENSAANIQSLSKSTSVIQGSIAKGEWSYDDIAAIAPHVANLTQEQRNELLKDMVEAINQQRLEIKAPLPPL